MKELMEERKKPHSTDIMVWRKEAAEAAEDLVRIIRDVSWEDPDSDYYSHERSVKVSRELKELAEELEDLQKRVASWS